MPDTLTDIRDYIDGLCLPTVPHFETKRAQILAVLDRHADLLAALREVIDAQDGWRNPSDSTGRNRVIESFRAARAAIAKAEGK